MPKDVMKIISLNCRGLRNKVKRYDIINYLKDQNAQIICLQDTHLIETDIGDCKQLWNGEIILHGQSTNSRGVAILLSHTLNYTTKNMIKDKEGNKIVLDIQVNDLNLKLINIYGPNKDEVSFYNSLNQNLNDNEQDYILWCGDFNMTLNPELDSYNYSNINNPNSRCVTLDIIKDHSLFDLYRHFHPDTRRYTWRRYKPLKQARLDYFIVSESLIDLVESVNIKPGYRTDHSMLEVNILQSKFTRGKGVWKFNTNLLRDQAYLELINQCIKDEVIKYAVPVYNMQSINTIPENELQITISENLFLEMLFLRIRGETVRYSSTKNKLEVSRESELLSDLEKLENEEDMADSHNKINQKQYELLEIREKKMKGHYVRSRAQWLLDGEKPTKFFCSLEKRNYINKTLKRIKRYDGTYITKQKDILTEFQMYYKKLFKSYDNQLEDLNLKHLFCDTEINKLNESQAKSLEGELQLEELNTVLKNMKHNKCPGIDGLPAEFLKVFWNRIKFWVLRALNYSFRSGTMPLSLRQCIITCLPKPGKPRDCIGNWRPLSMLCVVYKLASGAIANRIKPFLNFLINNEQTGFVPGRFIGESTRLIYDIMHYTQKAQIPGLLILIDFQKAFDSISWNFIYKTLSFLGFSNEFLKWIKLFNTEIKATVLQSGFMSEFISIGRGCRQGDPISPYLFIIAAQILNLLIIKNVEIKGITIKDCEFKISQFADDTTLILNGSRESMVAALNTLELFGSISGLKINTDKTKVTWIGKKRYSQDQLIPKKFEWNTTKFDLLGLKFSVDLSEMLDLNLTEKINQIKREISIWSKRHLTPLGKIVVVKTILLSKLNHLFSSLPTPTNSLLKELNDIFFKFVWSNKPDKINRDVTILDHSMGGLKMTHLQYFLVAIKARWINRLISKSSPWTKLFQLTILWDLRRLTDFGPDYSNAIQMKTSNIFWLDVLAAWKKLTKEKQINSNLQIASSHLWYNEDLSVKAMFYPKLYSKGIIMISDIIDNEGKVLTSQKLKDRYNLDSLNFLDYLRLSTVVHKFINKHKHGDYNKIIGPIMPLNYWILKNNDTSGFYKSLLVKHQNDHVARGKWENELNVTINNQIWKRIFQICHGSIETIHINGSN